MMKVFSKKIFSAVVFAMALFVFMPMAAKAGNIDTGVNPENVQLVDGVYYEYDDNGEKLGKYTGFLYDDIGKMFINNGKQHKGWFTAGDGKVYYFGTIRNGNYYAMKGNVKLGDYYLVHNFDENCVLTKGVWFDDGMGKGLKYYWAGELIRNKMYEIDGKTYFFDISAYVGHGAYNVGNDENGKAVYKLFDHETGYIVEHDNGFLVNGGKTYLYENGELVRGFVKYEGKYYFFSMKDCTMQYGKQLVKKEYSNGILAESRKFTFHDKYGWAMDKEGNPLTSLEVHTTHTYDKWIIDIESTCQELGECHRECTECTVIETGIIEMKPDHVYSKDYIVDKAATLTEDGSKSKHCIYCDVIDETSVTPIYKASTVKLSFENAVYNGKMKSPAVTIKDSEGNKIAAANYKLTKPSGRKNVGKYTYKVTFKNEYAGTKSMTLTIKPKATTIKALTKAEKAFTVKWNKRTTQVTGYQIQYATNKKFTANKVNKLVTSNKTISKKITGLKAKKTYYVRIRTYKTVKVNGKNVKIYSNWSAAKSIKTK